MILLLMFLVDTVYMFININHRSIEDKLLKLLVIKDSPEFLVSNEEKEEIDNSEDGSEI